MRMEPITERFQTRADISQSGPIKVADCDCTGCEEKSTLDWSKCRRCVFEGLAGEEEVDKVILGTSFDNIYTTTAISKLARTLGVLKTNVWDESYYAPESELKDCEECIEKRMEKMKEVWNDLMENPHDMSIIDSIEEEEGQVNTDECEDCTDENFLALLRGIRDSLSEVPGYSKLKDSNYDQVFDVRVQPFFLEGVWNPAPEDAEVLDSYELKDGRGKVKILKRENRPVPFYHLDLPEFDLSEEQVDLLHQAYKMEIDTAPSHARFAEPAKLRGFSEDWYNTLLQIVKEKSEVNLKSEKIRELAEMMSKWLNYKILEPISKDEDITDIYVEAPPEKQPVRIVHQRWGNCETGIYWDSPSLMGLAETLASKLGRTFDEPDPQLDAEIPELGLRLFISRHPVLWTENSAAAAIRKRRGEPWTQPLFFDKGSITPLASSFVSNMIRMGSSLFTIGDIGTAKTSYLITQIPEIGSRDRIITFQDTEEVQFEDFLETGYELENVRVMDAGHLEDQINAFLRGGAAYWLITEVRSTEAVKSALGAAARRGSQPVLSSFHARTKRQMYDLVCNIMGLHEAAYKYVDFIVSTGKFETSEGTIRRITEISEILKDWSDEPEYVELFSDDREEDILRPKNILSGDDELIEKVNSYDLTDLDLEEAKNNLEFIPPEEGGSRQVQRQCERLAINPDEFLERVLAEAKMKSEILMKSKEEDKEKYLELPFVTESYDKYFTEVEQNSPDYQKALSNWEKWLEGK